MTEKERVDTVFSAQEQELTKRQQDYREKKFAFDRADRSMRAKTRAINIKKKEYAKKAKHWAGESLKSFGICLLGGLLTSALKGVLSSDAAFLAQFAFVNLPAIAGTLFAAATLNEGVRYLGSTVAGRYHNHQYTKFYRQQVKGLEQSQALVKEKESKLARMQISIIKQAHRANQGNLAKQARDIPQPTTQEAIGSKTETQKIPQKTALELAKDRSGRSE